MGFRLIEFLAANREIYHDQYGITRYQTGGPPALTLPPATTKTLLGSSVVPDHEWEGDFQISLSGLESGKTFDFWFMTNNREYQVELVANGNHLIPWGELWEKDVPHQISYSCTNASASVVFKVISHTLVLHIK